MARGVPWRSGRYFHMLARSFRCLRGFCNSKESLEKSERPQKSGQVYVFPTKGLRRSDKHLLRAPAIQAPGGPIPALVGCLRKIVRLRPVATLPGPFRFQDYKPRSTPWLCIAQPHSWQSVAPENVALL